MTREQAQIIRWEEPPPPRSTSRPRRRDSRYDSVAVDLIAKPGRSGVIYEGPSRSHADNLAQRIREGWIACFPRGEFEARSRSIGGKYVVFAVYLGPGDEEE